MPYWVALLLTIACELAIALALTRRCDRMSVTRACLLVNLLTHPAANWIVRGGTAPMELVEVAVLIAEAIGYRWVLGWRWSRATMLALACNAVTWLLSYAV